METRTGLFYDPHPSDERKRRLAHLQYQYQQQQYDHDQHRRRRQKNTTLSTSTAHHFLDDLPDDLIVFIISKLSASASCPADLISLALVCKRFKDLHMRSVVLANASTGALSLKASKWSASAHRFLKACCDAGNTEANFILGMIRFYCFKQYGASWLLAKAAIGSHAAALYALAVIQFNGSGRTKNDKDLRSGVALCTRAAFLGHVDAMRELGHCLQDGYGIQQNVPEGRKFLVQANACELVAATVEPRSKMWHAHLHPAGTGCPLLSDFGCTIPPPKAHPANQFLLDWFAENKIEEGLRLCSHTGCGRPETRRHEFRRCSVCGKVNYCSRACQALDWKIKHKGECLLVDELDGVDENYPMVVHGFDGEQEALVVDHY